MSQNARSERVRRALAHQCPDCRRHWALRAVDHPSGMVILCRHCGTVQWRAARGRHLTAV